MNVWDHNFRSASVRLTHNVWELAGILSLVSKVVLPAVREEDVESQMMYWWPYNVFGWSEMALWSWNIISNKFCDRWKHTYLIIRYARLWLGLKKVTSRQVDFPARQATFHSNLPDRQEARQDLHQPQKIKDLPSASKIWKLLVQS